MAVVENLIRRADGSEAKIVAREYFGAGLTRSVGVDVFRRANATGQWTLCNDRPHPDWRSMSVDEYVRHGRSEMLQTVSLGEMLKTVTALNNPQGTFSGMSPDANAGMRYLPG